MPRLRFNIDPQRIAIVSGGTKGLGLEFAKQAATGGQKALVLMSRKPALAKAELIALGQRGAAVFVVKCDAANAAAAAAVQRWAAEQLPAVQTYAHAAGALGYDLIPDVTRKSFLDVTRAKVKPSSPPANILIKSGCWGCRRMRTLRALGSVISLRTRCQDPPGRHSRQGDASCPLVPESSCS